jgi:polygalacturonase
MSAPPAAFSWLFGVATVVVLSQPCGAQTGPSTRPDIPPPQIPDRVMNVNDFGAVGDGKTLATAALQKTIDACSQAGGGTVRIGPGTFLTGPLKLASNLDLDLQKGATLLFSNDTKDYKIVGTGFEHCIEASRCHDLAITGQGTIDGQGELWWKNFMLSKNGPSDTQASPRRPNMVELRHCTRILIRGVTLTNAPMFHLVPNACRDMLIDGVHISAPPTSPNTDGIDPSGQNFLITGCTIDVGDDCIALKPSGAATAGHVACEDFYITDCTFLHGHGLSIGGQTPGGMRHMIVRDCTFDGTSFGIRMKAGRGHGGLVEDLTYDNLQMKNVLVSILITSYYPTIPELRNDMASDEVTPLTPIWQHIHINNLTSTDGIVAGRIIGLPEMHVSDVVLNNVQISAKSGMEIANADGIQLVRSKITATAGPPLTILNSKVQENDTATLDVPP